ncbi:MAG TPA: hypothetical protein RMH99_03980 [Sandaracinaceae bacterium LLY-WYZ-13_1]|nr:hypothetical protein [Sandaracinaceae bacterium LLY-WYZ-13_1]
MADPAEEERADAGATKEGIPATEPRERRVSTPLVLAAASAMLAVTAVVLVSLRPDAPEPDDGLAPADANAFSVDDSSPERVAESFYDAWRRRRWPQALEISVGRAREAVLEKQAGDEAMPREERIVAERTWDALAQAPLTLLLDEAEMLGDDRYRLHGTAEYQLVGHPYRRRVSFLVEPTDTSAQTYRVAEMDLGEVLTELPGIFRGANPDGR